VAISVTRVAELTDIHHRFLREGAYHRGVANVYSPQVTAGVRFAVRPRRDHQSGNRPEPRHAGSFLVLTTKIGSKRLWRALRGSTYIIDSVRCHEGG
jgi:hypothetical protein